MTAPKMQGIPFPAPVGLPFPEQFGIPFPESMGIPPPMPNMQGLQGNSIPNLQGFPQGNPLPNLPANFRLPPPPQGLPQPLVGNYHLLNSSYFRILLFLEGFQTREIRVQLVRCSIPFCRQHL